MHDRAGLRGRVRPSLAAQVGSSAVRALRARQAPAHDFGGGLGLMGLVGWSVAMPTLLGVVLGHWLDGGHPGSVAWTVSLMLGGLALGCIAAWFGIAHDDRKWHAPGGKDDA